MSAESRLPSAAAQKGIALIMSLVMLLVLTLMTLSAFNLGKIGLQLVDNSQQRSQVENAAEMVVNRVVSSSDFTIDPTMLLDASGCPDSVTPSANSQCVDLYGDGKTVINVALAPAPACVQSKAVAPASLDLTKPEDLGCVAGVSQSFGGPGSGAGSSLCADSLWEINAVAKEATSNSVASVTLAVSLRVSNDAIETSCP
jgi:Tfp pilus assembly protein PilV